MKTIDIIFATFWFPPSKNVKLMSPEFEECINKYMDPREETRIRLEESETFFKKNKYDHDSYVERVKEYCAKGDTLMQTQSDFSANKFVKDMGELTLFRLNLKCISDHKTAKVGDIKDYSQQIWPSYMGTNADCNVKQSDVSLNVNQ